MQKKLVINIDENLKNILNEYFDGRITHIGVDNSIKLFEAVKNSTPLEQEPITKNDLEVDCISRIETIDYLCKHCPDDGECFKDCDEIKHLRQMPSVTPQLRKGHWISTETKGVRYAFWCRYKCSLCGGLSDHTNFCPNCGAKMESEDKE